uniref:CARD domain-containing protein n=1 Tax=Electrophorus electricus TaxID=8005 RepID=A0A4W4EQ47_ELEEL
MEQFTRLITELIKIKFCFVSQGLVQNSIMACTRQCATDYLKYARGDLVTRLQNFPLITENLCQHKVFNDHDVDALKAERTDFDKARFILDRVIKRGESPCHNYQKQLQTKAKRILSRRWNQCCKHLKHKTSANVTFIPLVLDTDPDLN